MDIEKYSSADDELRALRWQIELHKQCLKRKEEAHEADNARHAAEMEAFRREVSDVAQDVVAFLGAQTDAHPRGRLAIALARFIIPQPDPLVEVMRETGMDLIATTNAGARLIKDASDRLGYRLELVKKEPSQ